MKILIAADIFPPIAGGPATYSVALSNELCDRDALAGIVSLTLDSDKSKVKGSLVAVNQKNKLLRYIQYTYLLIRGSRGADLIYAMGPVNAGLPALFIARILGKKFVVKVVGDYAWEQGTARFAVKDLMDEFQGKNNYGWQVVLLKKIESFVACHADKVIVPSQYLKKIVEGWGARVAKIQVIYNAVKVVKGNTAKKPEGEKWVVTSGRLMPWKGVDTLISIMPDLLKEFSNVKLKVIGDGPMMKQLRSKRESLKLESSVDLLGNLPRDEAASVMGAADVFVLNSGYEGLSHVLLEAIGLNLRVLASDIGGNPEIVIGGQTGDLFEYNNAPQIKKMILDLLRADSAGSYMRSAETERILKSFSFEFMINTTVDALKAV